MSRGFRERIAVSLLGAAVVLGAVLGVMTVRSFTQPASTALVQQGEVSGAQSGASPAAMPAAPGGAASQSSGGSGGVAGGKITIGGFFDITGPVDSSVERDTVRAYMQAVNQAGGINGRPVEYGDRLSFPVSANFYRYGTAIADEAKALGAKHPAVVVLGDVPWVHPVEANLLNRLAANGIAYTDVEEVSATQASYTATVFNLQHSHHGPSGGGAQPSYQCPATDKSCPDYVIAALDPFSYHRLFDAMQAANWYPGVLGAGLDKFNVQKSYGGELRNAHSLVPFLSPYDHQGNSTVRQYLGTVQHYYPGQFQALDIYTQHSWTAAMVFVEAARKAGKNLSRDSLVQALNSIQGFQTGWSVPLSYCSGNHDPNHSFTSTSNNGGGWRTTTQGWICS